MKAFFGNMKGDAKMVIETPHGLATVVDSTYDDIYLTPVQEYVGVYYGTGGDYILWRFQGDLFATKLPVVINNIDQTNPDFVKGD